MDKKIKRQLARLNTKEELSRFADDLSRMADEIESGEIIALSWVEHRSDGKFRPSWVKGRGVTLLEMLGGATRLVNEVNKAWDKVVENDKD